MQIFYLSCSKYFQARAIQIQVGRGGGGGGGEGSGWQSPSCSSPDKHQPETPMHASVAIVLYIKQESG